MPKDKVEEYDDALFEEIMAEETTNQGTALELAKLPALRPDGSVDAKEFYTFLNARPDLGKVDFYIHPTGDVYLLNTDNQVYRNDGQDVRLAGLTTAYPVSTSDVVRVYTEDYGFVHYPAYYLTADNILAHYNEEPDSDIEDSTSTQGTAYPFLGLVVVTVFVGILLLTGRIPNWNFGFIGVTLLSVLTGASSYLSGASRQVKGFALFTWAVLCPAGLFIATSGLL